VNLLRGEFHFIYNTDKYDSTVSFYRDGLELPIIAAWDEGPEDRGTVFRAASGIIEVMAHPETSAGNWKVYSPKLLQGANLAFEVEDVEGWYLRALEKKMAIKHPLEDFNWGQRGFALLEPNNLVVFIYSTLVTGLEASAANLEDV
jgi:catechol 2,3-dioxygenase-like lactoylglutathione lyase family enzyme